MAKARFQGVYPNGTRYDVPEVPWILAFSGDYTIHAAPWRSQFGQVGSNGCVTLPTDAARFVYDWAGDGTPIDIRY
jgi:lipoprotein-anchoring transpeptidase ErfK/SrfK